MISAVILDIDETLYSYIAAHTPQMEVMDLYCQKTFGWAPGEVHELWSKCYRKSRDILGVNNCCIHDVLLRIQFMLEEKGINPLPYAQRMSKTYWDNFYAAMKPEPYVHEFIQAAKAKGCRIGAATDYLAEEQYLKLERLGLLEDFDFIVSSEEAGVEKPERKLYEFCLAKAGCPAEECLVIGDNWSKDCVGAFNLGMQAAWYQSETFREAGKGLARYSQSEQLTGNGQDPQKYIVTSFKDLIRWLE